MDNVVESEVSLLYKAMVPAALLAFSFIDYLFIHFRYSYDLSLPYYMVNRYYLFSIPVIWIIVIAICFALWPQKISVSDYGVLFYANFFKEQRRITWDEIAGIGIQTELILQET